MAADTWLLFQSPTLIQLRTGLLLSCPVFLLLGFRRAPLPPTVRRLLVGAFGAFVYGLVATTIHGDSLVGVSLLFKVFFPFAFVAIAAGLLHSQRRREAVMSLFFWVGVVIAVQTLIIGILIAAGNKPGV